MGRALKTNSDWAPQAEEAADMAGTPERLSCWPQALPEMDSLGSVRYWSNELVFQLFSPSAVTGDPLSCTNPSARLGFKIPPGSEPSKISTCRAGPAVEGVPGHIQTPCPSCAPHTEPCTAPVPRCALQSSLNHSSIHPGPARHSHCPSLLLQSPVRLPVPAAPLFSSRLGCSHRGFPAQAQVLKVFQPRLSLCPSETRSRGIKGEQVACEDCSARLSN